MRTPNTPRLVNPQQGHERIAQRAYGAKSVRELDNGITLIYEEARAGSDKRPRITGNLTDGTAFREAITAGEREGLWDDDLDVEPDDLPPIYENNHPLIFRGVKPSVAAGAQAGGAGLSISNSGTDNAGRLTITPGAGTAAGAILVVTFNVPKQNDDYEVYVFADDSDASGTAGQSRYVDFGTKTTTAWTLSVSTALTAGTSYHFGYLVIDVYEI